jgi:hypothetical protein
MDWLASMSFDDFESFASRSSVFTKLFFESMGDEFRLGEALLATAADMALVGGGGQ